MQHLGGILKNYSVQSPLRKSVTSSLVVEKANEAILVMFGDEIQNMACAVSFKDGVLRVKTTSTSVSSGIKMRENELFEGLFKLLGQQIVRQIIYTN